MSFNSVVFEAAALIVKDAEARQIAPQAKPDYYAKCTSALLLVLGAVPAELAARGSIQTGDSEVEKDVQKVEAAARGTTRKEAADNQAEIEAERGATADPKPDASGAADTKATPDGAQPAGDDTPLDYLKDVAPTLNKLAKANRDGLVAIFAAHGAKKGADLKPEQFRGVLDAATKALAEAG